MKKRAYTKVIKDIDGNTLYEGRAKSLKHFVQQCVQQGLSLKRADLAGLDLMHLDLTNGDFTEARLDGAKLRGSVLRHASFRHASLKGVAASGVFAEYADFKGVDLSPLEYERPREDGAVDRKGNLKTRKIVQKSDFVGSILTYANFDGAIEREVDFSQSAMSSSTHAGAMCRKCNYDRALLHNVDWEDAHVIRNSFREAKMSPRMNVDTKHLPARTKNAIIVGNTYENTEFGPGNRDFVVDSMLAGKIHVALFGLVTSGLFVATSAMPFDLEGVLDHTVGKTAAFVLAASALTWIRTPLEDLVKDAGVEYMAHTAVRIRAAVADLWKRGKSIAGLTVALLDRKHAGYIEKFIKARHDGFVARFAAAARGDYDVVVCDREHLSEALARISEVMTDRDGKKHSVILLRAEETREGDRAPRAVVINPDGSLEAVWDQDEDGRIRHRVWDAATFPVAKGGREDTQMGPFNQHVDVIQRFMDALLETHGLQDFKVNHATHMMRQGSDNSVVVVRASDGRLDNKGGPTIITPDDRRYYFRNSVAYDADGRRVRDTNTAPPSSQLSPA